MVLSRNHSNKEATAMKHLYLGIDWGKKFSHLFGFDEDGVVVIQGRVETLDVAAWRRVLKSQPSYSIHAVFEIGAHYDWLYDLLKEYCAEVSVIDPAQFAVISRSQRKTDKIDAQKLAEGLRRGDLPLVHVPDKQTRSDRRLVAFTHGHSKQSARVKGKIRSLLLAHRLECPFTNVTGVGALKWLREQAIPKLDAQAQMFLRILLEQIELLDKQRKELDKHVAERASSYEQTEIIDSIPGLGSLGILAVLSSIAGVARFKRPEQLSSYFGTCGSVFQSGGTLVLGGLTHRGNVHVRWLLSQALQHLHRKDPRARMRYLKLKRKKPRGVARAAQVRWLTEIIWWMLMKNESYRIKKAA
jgi:transposase